MSNLENYFDFSNHIPSYALDNLTQALSSDSKNIYISGLKGNSKYFLLSLLVNAGKEILYVSQNKEELEFNVSNLSSILGKEIPCYFSKKLDKKTSLFDRANLEEINRIDSLHQVTQSKILCTDLISLFEFLPPSNIIQNSEIEIKVGEEIDRDSLISDLKQLGYLETDFVEKEAEISIRGSIIDIFSTGYNYPHRLEFFGDAVKSIRKFNPSTQKSLVKLEQLIINPASFILYKQKEIESIINKFKKAAETYGLNARDKKLLFDSITNGIKIEDIEWFNSYFYEANETLIDYFSKDLILFFDELPDIKSTISSLEEKFNDSPLIGGKFNGLVPDFEHLYISGKELTKKLSEKTNITLGMVTDEIERKPVNFDTEKLSIEKNSISTLCTKIKELQSNEFIIFLYSYSESESSKIQSILNENKIDNINYQIGNLDSGFIFNDFRIAVITENDFTKTKKTKSKSFSKFADIPSVFITSFSDLKPGDLIVHKEFGIGIFNGLKKLEFNNRQADFIECEYKGEDKIYVPVEKMGLIQRYIGDNKKPQIEKLGSENWKKTVKRVKKAVENIAKDLLELYAKRKMDKGFKFSPRDQLFNEFELGFPYNETHDQAKSIEEVMQDMESDKPMDRLICGDVGFGKTEVALRAAFKAVMDGKQVLFISPTTILTNQHYQNSLNRFKDYPVTVEMLSRFRTTKHTKEILNKIENGSLDIVVGTHKLLSSKIQFKNLGLIIIDEEQKFGVKHKEYLRSLKSGIDVLALSATPIPRTLQLSLTEIRDISLINTPPEGRKPVDVYIQVFNPESVRKAIIDEINRDGKVFFVHNRIEKIFEIAEMLKNLVPEANIAVTHGRMNEKTLETSLKSFIYEDINVLITTAIVESGLDIPAANTIIVNDAHTFGLADLYQLKGRVGRSKTKAFSYFLIPSISKLSPDAKRRLEVLSELTDLGSGFKLALSDLEIRGAGNLFGKEQSGHIANIGLEFYLELLKSTINRIKDKEHTFDYEPEIKTNQNAYIPDNYIESSSQRLFYYKKISSIQKKYEIKEIIAELEDKFGPIPKELNHLLKLADLKIIAKNAFIKKVDIQKDQAILTFLEISPYSKMFMPSKKMKIYFKSEDKYKVLNKRIKELIDGKHKK